MKATFRLGRIAGIGVGIHYSWFLLLAIVTWSLANQFFPTLYNWHPATYWGTSLIAALLLFVSVLLHEFAHSLVAKARGIYVDGITLFMLGGVSNLGSEPRRAKEEFAISVVGPAMSLALSGVFWLALLALPDKTTPLPGILTYLAFVNLLLAAFNLIPAFPLDGGRVLRSVVWGISGNFARATKIAARCGQLFGILMLALGVFQILQGYFLGVLWMLIGWFLFGAASASMRKPSTAVGLGGALVGDVMSRRPDTVGPELPIGDAVYGHFLGRGVHALLVCDGSRLEGVLTVTDLKRVPQDQWNRMRVRNAMTPAPLWSLAPGDHLARAINLLAAHDLNQVPVIEGDRLVGVLTRTDLVRFLAYQQKKPD